MPSSRRTFLSSLVGAVTALIVRPTMALAKMPPKPTTGHWHAWNTQEKIISGVYLTFGPVQYATVAVFADQNPRPLCEAILTDWPYDINGFYIPIPPTAGREFRITFDVVGEPFTLYQNYLLVDDYRAIPTVSSEWHEV